MAADTTIGTIDTVMLGEPAITGAFLVRSERTALVATGPRSTVEQVLKGLADTGVTDLDVIAVTHVHLDHAGAAGVLARRFPELVVYVHERGAPHLVDPSRLLESAARLYRDEMERLWGEVVPVPEERVRPLSGGERVEGFRVVYTPGHASHHVSYLHEDTGDAYVGDMAGVRIPPNEHTWVPTPPPDIDVQAWLTSLDTVAGWRPTALCLTHFGCHRDVHEQLARLRGGLLERAEQAQTMEPGEFAAWSETQTRAAVDPETAEALIQAAPPDTLGMGLRRYWEKKAT